jgi:glycerol-3-phosphate O-acyltransferase/dihydroxyacetone phosphate acyltransferase
MHYISRKPAYDWIYDLIVRIFSWMVEIFFREIKVQNASYIPNEGSVIL